MAVAYKTLIFANVFSIALAFTACAPDSKVQSIATVDEIVYNGDKPMSCINSIIDTLEYIPLYGSVEFPIGRADDLQISDNGFFILDQRRGTIHAYDMDGIRRFQINRLGHGEGEYLEIACFTLTDNYILTVDNFTKKINAYSLTDGRYITYYKSPFPICGLRALANGDFIIAELTMEGTVTSDISHNMRLYITDQKFNIKSSALPFGEGRDHFMMPQHIQSSDDYISYASYGFNGFTLINPENGEILANVPLTTELPYDANILSKSDMDDLKKISDVMNKLQFISSTPIYTSQYVYFNIRDNGKSVSCIYSNADKKWYKNSSDNYANLFMPPETSYTGKFYSMYNFGPDFLEEQLKMGFNRPDNISDSIIRNNGSVILVYTMK